MGCGDIVSDDCMQLNVPGLQQQLNQWCTQYNVSSYDMLIPKFNLSECDCRNAFHLYIPTCNCTTEKPPFPYGEVLPLGVVYALVFLLGSIGNTLVIFVIRRFRRMRTTTNLFLGSLAIADLCLICFCLPIQYAKYLSHSWFFDAFLCYSVHYVQQLTRFCSVLTLTAISIERYIAIAFPMKRTWVGRLGRTKKIIFMIWISAAILAIPTGLRIDYVNFVDARNSSMSWCQRQFPVGLESLEEIYGLYQFMTLLVLPLTCMIFCYIRVAKAVNQSSHDESLRENTVCSRKTEDPGLSSPTSAARGRRKSSSMFTKWMSHHEEVTSPTKAREQNRKQIMQILVAIVLLYIICWTGTLIDELLVCFKMVCHTSRTEGVKKLRMTLAVLAFSNSAINPIIYAFLSRNFRASFRMACRCGKDHVRSPTLRTIPQMQSVTKRRTPHGPHPQHKSSLMVTKTQPDRPPLSKHRKSEPNISAQGSSNSHFTKPIYV